MTDYLVLNILVYLKPTEFFKEESDLIITCETNLKAVNFLDVTLNLTTGKYQPYKKNPDNHLPNVTENIPSSISKRINNLSADETTFNSIQQCIG